MKDCVGGLRRGKTISREPEVAKPALEAYVLAVELDKCERARGTFSMRR